MNQYYVVGLTQAEVAKGEGFQQVSKWSEITLKEPLLFVNEKDKVLVYGSNMTELDESFRDTYGKYFDYIFIKDSFKNLCEKHGMSFKVIASLSENELPAGLDILIKL